MTNEDVYKPPIGIREAWRESTWEAKVSFVFSVTAACLTVPVPLILFLLGVGGEGVVPIAWLAAVLFALLGISFGRAQSSEEARALSRLSIIIAVLAILPIAVYVIVGILFIAKLVSA